MNTNETVIEVPVLETAPVLVKPSNKKKGPAREGKPVVVVEVVSETTVVEETAETAPVAKYKCSVTGKLASADELRCPPLGVLKAKLNKELLSEDDLISAATLPRFTRWSDPENSLAARLEYIRQAKAKFDANEARKDAFRAFAYDLPRGEVREYNGVEHIKCGQGKCMWVAPVSQFRFPDVGIMVRHNPLMIKETDQNGEPVLNEQGKPKYVEKLDRQGNVICIVPTVAHALRKFACCPRCSEANNLDESNSMDYETTLVVVAKAKEEADSEFAARKAKWERQNAQRNGGANGSQSRGFSMDDVVRDRTATTRGRQSRRDSDRSDTKDFRNGGWDE